MAERSNLTSGNITIDFVGDVSDDIYNAFVTLCAKLQTSPTANELFTALLISTEN